MHNGTVFLSETVFYAILNKIPKGGLSLKKKAKKTRQPLKLQNFLMLLVSGTVNALGVTMFLTPVGLYDSGISGTSMLLDQLTPTWLTRSVFMRQLPG